jgi:parallel beta-helix repeat protein
MGESDMDKKPLMGVCILAVVLLILGSLSNVVGYQSVKILELSDSLIFIVGTKRTINRGSDLDNNNEIHRNITYTGKTIYVDDNNTDGPWNGTLEHPYRYINDATKNSSDGDTIFVFNGTYNEHVHVPTSVHLIGENKNTTIIDGGGVDSSTIAFDAYYIYLSGFTIRDCGDWSDNGGIWITDAWSHHSGYNTITNNIICNNKNYGILAYQSSYNIITNNVFKDNHGGIDFGSISEHNVIALNIFINNTISMWGCPEYTNISENYFRDTGIGLARGDNNEIRDNYFENNCFISISDTKVCLVQNNIVISSKGSQLKIITSSDVTIKDNNLSSFDGITISSSSNFVIRNNSVGLNGISITGGKIGYWNSHIIENNYVQRKLIFYYKNSHNITVPSNASYIILANCSNCTIKNSVINSTAGLQLGFSSKNSIINNIILNTINNGIRLSSSSYNNISRNTIANNSYDGIVLDGDSNTNIFFENTITHNTHAGIELGSYTFRNKIIQNRILFNTEYGIEIYGFANEIDKNLIKNNKQGVFIYYSSNNSLKKNDFIQNVQHVVFTVDYRQVHSNLWNANYFDDKINIFPRLLIGIVKTRFYLPPLGPYGGKIYIYRQGFNIDWHPVIKPYNIPGMK